MSLANLSIDLTAKIASFEAELKRSTQIAEQQAAKMQAALGLASKALAGLGAGLSVTAFVGLIRSSADVADEMSKISRRAGVTTEAMSELSYAASLADVDNTELARALRTLGNDAAAGGKKIKALNIDLVDANGKARTSDELFREVAQRIAGIEDPAKKAAVASELFGDKLGGQMIPLLEGGREGLEKAADEAMRFNKVISTEAGKAAEEFNDNLTRLQARLTGFSQTLANPVITGLNSFFGAIERGMQRGAVAGLATDVIRLNNDLKALEARRDNPFINQEKLEENIRQTREKLEAAKGIFLKAQRDFENPPQSIAPSAFEPSAAALGVTKSKGGTEKVTEAQRYLQSLQRQLESTQKLTAEEALLRDISLGRLGKVSGAQKEALQDLARQLDAAHQQAEADKDRLEIVRAQRQIAIEEHEAVMRANDEYQSLIESLVNATPTAKLEEQRRVMEMLANEYERGRFNAEQYAEVVQTYLGNLPQQVEKSKSAVDQLNMSFQSAFEDAVVSGKKLSSVLTGLGQDIARLMLRKSITEPLGNSLSNLFSGMFGNLFGGFRASGGPVTAGKAYMVGERGPELLYMGGSGTVVPNHAMGGTVVYSPTFQFNGPADQSLVMTAAQLGAAMGRQAIYDDMARGRMA